MWVQGGREAGQVLDDTTQSRCSGRGGNANDYGNAIRNVSWGVHTRPSEPTLQTITQLIM